MKRVALLFAVISLAAAGTVFASEKGSHGAGEGEEAAHVVKAGVQEAVLEFVLKRACEVHGVCSLGTIRARYEGLGDEVREKDGYYVITAEFKAGKDVFDIEYYLQREGGTYVVVKEVILKRNGKLINEVLWQGGERKAR